MVWPAHPKSVGDLPSEDFDEIVNLSPRAEEALLAMVSKHCVELDAITKGDSELELKLGTLFTRLAVDVETAVESILETPYD